MTTKIVNIGDGRFIEMTTGGPSAPPKVAPKKKPRPNKFKRVKTKRTLRPGFIDKSSKVSSGRKAYENIPGYTEWLSRRALELEAVHPDPKRCSPMGIPHGMKKAEAMKAWELARQLADRDIKRMKDAGILDDADTQAEAAMRATLEVMHSPMDQKMKLAAARQVLEWTKAKPAAKTEMTVNTAEAWLASLADEPKVD